MRWICWACVSLTLLALLSPAGVLGAGCGCGGQYNSYAAPACGAPCYGLQVGCCENPPSPCANAWDGYCEEKARRNAFYYRIGTGTAFGATTCVSCRSTTCASCTSASYGNQPAAVPEPAPVDADVSPLPDAPLPPEPAILHAPTAMRSAPGSMSGEPTDPLGRSWLPSLSAVP